MSWNSSDFKLIGSENLHVSTDSLLPPPLPPQTTQSPDDKPFHSSQPSSASEKSGAEYGAEEDDDDVKNNESLEVSPLDTSEVMEVKKEVDVPKSKERKDNVE
eukprot:760667-Ditylum_brightwellii.AAC.1